MEIVELMSRSNNSCQENPKVLLYADKAFRVLEEIKDFLVENVLDSRDKEEKMKSKIEFGLEVFRLNSNLGLIEDRYLNSLVIKINGIDITDVLFSEIETQAGLKVKEVLSGDLGDMSNFYKDSDHIYTPETRKIPQYLVELLQYYNFVYIKDLDGDLNIKKL